MLSGQFRGRYPGVRACVLHRVLFLALLGGSCVGLGLVLDPGGRRACSDLRDSWEITEPHAHRSRAAPRSKIAVHVGPYSESARVALWRARARARIHTRCAREF